MRILTSAVASIAALGLLFVGGSGPSRALTIAPVSPLGAFSSLQPRFGAAREEVLHRFAGGSDGFIPYSVTLAVDKTGALYGTTLWGGGGPSCSGRGCGTVFKLTPAALGYTESILYRFQDGLDGSNPIGGLLIDASGALYGTTSAGGGREGRGTVFKLTPARSGYAESILYRFNGGDDGASPWAGLIRDKSGALYGTTLNGGSKRCSGRCGTVFRLTPAGSGYAEAILYRFQGVRDGAYPYASLILDKGGALYGTTAEGGGVSSQCGAACGTVFRLTPVGSGYAETVLHRFNGSSDGESPIGGLIADRNGALYGTTSVGTLNFYLGTVFKLTPTGSGYSERILYAFQRGVDASQPTGGLIVDKNGALYGTTYWGGAHNFGTVFKLTPSGSGYAESVLWSFAAGNDGETPDGGLIADRSGALYGTTPFGGRSVPECGTCGTVFKIIP